MEREKCDNRERALLRYTANFLSLAKSQSTHPSWYLADSYRHSFNIVTSEPRAKQVSPQIAFL